MTDIDSILSSWQVSNKIHFTGRLRHQYEEVDLEAAAERARRVTNEKSPDKDGWAVPLHKEDELEFSGKYVIWRPEQSEIGWRNRSKSLTGEHQFDHVSELADTEIGHRMRFWVPEDRVEEEDVGFSLPPKTISPTNNLDDKEKRQFFQDLLRFVREEKGQELESGWESYEELGDTEVENPGNRGGPFVPFGEGNWRHNSQGFKYQLAESSDDGNEEVDLRNDYDLFVDTLVAVDATTDSDVFPFEAEIEGVYGPNVVIKPNWDQIKKPEILRNHLDNTGPDIWLSPLLNPVPYNRRIEAIHEVREDREKSELITGNRDLRFSSVGIPESTSELNQHQRKAMAWSDRAKDLICIHGPPGTGKTRTLSEYVRRAVDIGHSVIVTAHSNQAVDNIITGGLHQIAQENEDFTIARTGSRTENDIVEKFYIENSSESADVVASTTNGAAEFDQDRFDIAIVDEATQASRPATAIVLNCASKLVLAGDHKQLPPFYADETMQEEDLHISLFEYVLERYNSEPSVFLKKQYRMNHKIAEFANQSFYDNQLETAERNYDWTIDDLKPIMGIDLEGEEQQEYYGNSYFNQEEAEAAAKQVQLLVNSGVAPDDIGVITAYSGQKRIVRNAVEQIGIEEPGAVTIDTVDSFQGGEREAIIISFVRSNDEGKSGFLEFPEEGPRRLNVALTRAKKRLVIIGNWNTLGSIAPHRSSETSCAALYSSLEEYIRDNNLML